jgi:hypothetical protein
MRENCSSAAEGVAVQGVKQDGERVTVDITSSRYLPAEDAWAFDYHGDEFVVFGGPEGPDPARLDAAGFVAARIDEFVAEANGYLAAFVLPEKFEASGLWELQGVQFGRNPVDPPKTFEMLLVIDGDPYGLWGVQFVHFSPPLDRYYPVQFSRRQW